MEELITTIETYTSFAGAEMHCIFSEKEFGTLKGITYSISKPKSPPIYTMGSDKPRKMCGHRTRSIAGSLIFESVDFDLIPVGDGVTIFGPQGAIPPFDVIVQNPGEIKNSITTLSIYGIELINQGSCFTINDYEDDKIITFIARDVGPKINMLQ